MVALGQVHTLEASTIITGTGVSAALAVVCVSESALWHVPAISKAEVLVGAARLWLGPFWYPLPCLFHAQAL